MKSDHSVPWISGEGERLQLDKLIVLQIDLFETRIIAKQLSGQPSQEIFVEADCRQLFETGEGQAVDFRYDVVVQPEDLKAGRLVEPALGAE